MDDKIKKNGLIYTSDKKCVIAVDSASAEFNGVVPTGPVEIAEEAFSCCSLKNISLPDSVQRVGANLFCNSVELETVKLPKNLKQLSPYMFCGCKKLTHIDMPTVVDDFTEGLFAECSSLPEIPFRTGIKTLPEGVIDSCDSITSLVIPDTVATIQKGAINNCASLTTIVLPASLKDFDNGAVASCPKLSRIRISDNNKDFRTDEDCRTLQKKVGSSYMAIFSVPNRDQTPVPSLNEDNGGSVLPIDEDSDEVDENTENTNDVIFGKNEGSNMDNAGVTQITTQGMDVINTEPDVTAAAVSEDDVAKRLSDIMGQEKQYSDDNFTIMDIPEASEEEMQAEKLPADLSAQEQVATSASAGERPPEPPKVDIQGQVAEIIKDNTADETVGITNIQVASGDEPDENAAISNTGVSSSGAERLAMNDLVFETEKVKQNVIISDAENEKILYVFAESLSQTQFGLDFSTRLVKCAERLADIHKFTSIFYFYSINMEDDSFCTKLQDYLKDKNCLIACAAGNLSTVSNKAKDLAKVVGVSLDMDELQKQAEYARSVNSPTLKLLIQDIMD